MHLHLQNPYPLLFTLIPLTLFILSPKKLLLPALASLLITLAIASPSISTSTPPDHLIILLDLMLPPATPPRDPQYLRELAAKTLPPQTRLTIVAFAHSQKILLDDISPTDSDHWPAHWNPFPDDHPTNLPAALAWRTPTETDSTLLPRWLLTDALTAPIISPPNMHLTLTLIPAQPDIAITDFLYRSNGILLAHLHTSNFYNLEFIIQNLAVSLTLSRNNKVILTQQLTLSPNEDRCITLQDPTPATSPTLYKLQLHATPPDLFPENDTASLLYTPPGPPTILEIKSPNDLPPTLTQLLHSHTQALLLHDTVPLSPQNLQVITQFVQDTGGGLLLLGTNFPPKITALSPLTPDNPTRPPLHLTLLLDTSGSMNEPINAEPKLHLAIAALAQAASLLHPTDHLTLITFSNSAQLQLDTTAKDFPQLLQQTRLTATGPTNPDAALPLLQQQLANPNEKQILLLLTDGQIPTLNLPQWKSLLQNTPFLLIAPNTLGPLQNLLTLPHTHLFPTTDPTQWQSLLQQSLTSQLITPTRHDPLTWHTLHIPPLTGTTTEWTQLYLSTNSQPLAQDNLNHPFAALAHRGLGHVAATLSSTIPPQLQAYLLTQITPPESDPRFTVTTTRIPNGYHLILNALENNTFLNTERLTLRVLSENPPKEIPIPLTAPGKYELDLQTSTPLSAFILRGSEEIIVRVEPAQVETTEWPATVGRMGKIDESVTILEPNYGGEKDRFWGEKRWDLRRICWVLGAIFAPLSLAVRRR